jgi:hypothetical protein
MGEKYSKCLSPPGYFDYSELSGTFRDVTMDVKPLHAVLVVAIFVVLVGVAAYSGTQARLIQGPSDLQMDREGGLHVRIGEQIFVYDDLFRMTKQYGLNRFGIEGLLGSFDFFSDNSVLLVAENILPGQDLDPGRLLRCSFESGRCLALSRAEHSFNSTFRVSIDEQDNVFLADTASGSVYWLDTQGEHRDKLARVLGRPNQIARYEDQLVIAHTEGTELLLVPLVEGDFSQEADWRHIALDSASNQSRHETRPIDFLQVADSWFVLAKREDMRSGAIYHFDSEGAYVAHFTLPENTDPFALAYQGGSLFIADYAGLEVYRYSVEGQLQGNLDSPAQAEYIDQLRQRQDLFFMLEYASWGLFGLALVIGFALAIKSEISRVRHKKEEAAEQTTNEGRAKLTARPHPLDTRIHWILPRERLLWIGLFAVALALLIPVVIGLGDFSEGEHASGCSKFTLGMMTWGTVGIMLLVLVPLLLKLRSIAFTRIGVCDEWVLVDYGNGVVRMARDEDLLRVPNGFIIEQVTVPTGNHQQSLYDKKELEQWLQPRLKRGGELGPIKQLAWQWQNKRGLFIAGAIAVVLMLIAVVATEMGWLEHAFEQWVESRPECQKSLGAILRHRGWQLIHSPLPS